MTATLPKSAPMPRNTEMRAGPVHLVVSRLNATGDVALLIEAPEATLPVVLTPQERYTLAGMLWPRGTCDDCGMPGTESHAMYFDGAHLRCQRCHGENQR